jgi:hypothetical protein
MRCFKVQEVICVDEEEKIMINLTRRKYKILKDEEYFKLIEELEKYGKELEVFVIADHRYFPRTYYAIYSIKVGKRYKYFVEVYDGSSASYSYIFCKSRKECESTINDLEEDNIAMD